jgi:Transposase DDE domain
VAASAAAAAAKGKPPPTLKPRARDEAPNPKATANVTDPDSRLLHTRKGRVQGYNAQAVTTCEQVIVAAELTQDANDFQQLQPMLDATSATLATAGIQDRPETLAADSGYWSIANLTEIPDAPQLLIPPPKHGRHGKPRKDGKPSASRSDGLRAAMTAKLQSEDGKACYAKRKETVEPVLGQIKEQQGARRFLRRGLRACEAEWKLLCGTHKPAQIVAPSGLPATCCATDRLSAPRTARRRGAQLSAPHRPAILGPPLTAFAQHAGTRLLHKQTPNRPRSAA